MDGRSRPYFFGVDQALNFQQKETLAQGIQQVVETTPAGFEFFEFQFTGYRVYIYKLDRGIILLVLTGAELVHSDYVKAIDSLKAELKEDVSSAIATFRLLAGNITLSNQNYWKRREHSTSTLEGQVPPPLETSDRTPGALDNIPPAVATSFTASPEPEAVPQPSAQPPQVAQIDLKELLAALNHFSQFTTQYLGNTVVTNYWKTTRPTGDWLANFQVDRSAQITFSGTAPSHATALTPEQHQLVQEWTAAFIQRCSKVIRDLPMLIEQGELDEHHKKLLFSHKN